MKLKYGFLEMIYSDEEIVSCAAEDCPQIVQHGDVCYIDTQTPGTPVFCKLCGPCERYHRKKSAQRINKI